MIFYFMKRSGNARRAVRRLASPIIVVLVVIDDGDATQRELRATLVVGAINDDLAIGRKLGAIVVYDAINDDLCASNVDDAIEHKHAKLG